MKNQLPSNKKFGSFMSSILILLSGYFFFKNLFLAFYFSILLSLFFLIATLFNHQILTKLNQQWFYLGCFLGKLVSPIVLGVIFFLLITPVALIGKIFGRDILLIKRPLKIESYWIELDDKDRDDNFFDNQF